MITHLKQLASESLIYGLAGVISRFLAVFLVPITTRIFSPADYGVMSLVLTTNGLLTIFMVLALDNSAFRWYYDSDDAGDRHITFATWAWCQFGVSSLLSLSMIVLSGSVSQLVLGDGTQGLLFIVAAMVLPVAGPGLVLTNWLRCQRRAWATVAYTVGSTLCSILLTILFVVVMRKGVVGVLYSQLTTATLQATLAVFLMRGWLDPRHFRLTRLREMLAYSFPLVPGAIAVWLLSVGDRYFLRMFASTEQVGLYHTGAMVASFVALVVSAFTQAWGPFALSIRESPEARDVYGAAFLGYTWLACLLATAITLLAPEALSLLTPPAYHRAATVVGLLAFGWVMEGQYYVASLGASLAKVTKPIGMAVLIAAALTVVMNLLLIPRLGMIGAGIAAACSYTVRAGYLFYRSQRIYAIPYRFGAAGGILALGVALMTAGAWIPRDNLVFGIVLKVLLLSFFIPLLPVLRIVSLDDVRKALKTRLAPAAS